MFLKKIWKGIGIFALAGCVMFSGMIYPTFAEEATTDDEFVYDEREKQFAEIFCFNRVYEDMEVTVLNGEEIMEDYEYLFPSVIYPSAFYLVDQEGRALCAAICLVNGQYFCTDADGKIVKGCWEETSQGKWMYFGWDGCALTSQWVYLNNTWYYLNEKGIMVDEWNLINGKWYYMDETSGAMQTGWIKLGKTDWYYLDPVNGDMKTGWLYENGSWYYLQDSGLMATGWLLDGSTWYYLESSGAMKTGWQKGAGDTWYYLKADGAMACNEKLTIDGVSYSFNQSGEWIH